MQNIKPVKIITCLGLVLTLIGCTSVNQVQVQTPEAMSAPLTTPAINLAIEMRQIGTSYRAFNDAKTLQEALVALSQLEQAIERSGYVYPEKIQSVESEKIAYLQDLERMRTILDESMSMVKANQLDAAKAHAKQLNEIKDIAHKRYR